MKKTNRKTTRKGISRLVINCPAHTRNELVRRAGAHQTLTDQALYSLDMFWATCRIGLKSAASKINRDQAQLILDIQNGTFIDHSGLWAWISAENNGLTHQVQDGIDLDGLDEKWGVDKSEILNAIASLTEIELLAVIDWAKTFWTQRNPDIKKAVAKFKEV